DAARSRAPATPRAGARRALGGERVPDASVQRRTRDGARDMRDDAAAPVGAERLGHARESVLGVEPVALVDDRRIRQPVAANEAAGVAGEVLVVDTEHDELSSVALRGLLQEPRLVATRNAPRRPEVDDLGSPVERGGR